MLGLLAGGARDTARGVVANLLDDVAAYASLSYCFLIACPA